MAPSSTKQILEAFLMEKSKKLEHYPQDINMFLTISNVAIALIQNPVWDQECQAMADLIIRISNLYYNNTSITVLPLDDGIYDQLLTIYKNYNPYYQVGAKPIQQVHEIDQQQYDESTEKKVMYRVVRDADLDASFYGRSIMDQHTPLTPPKRNMYRLIQPDIKKRMINTKHKYPELVGTLDKCKFVLNHDAMQAGVYDSPSVSIFERDFIHKCLRSGVINEYEKFDMIGELKYDGVSVEAEICGDRIITALSRGDTADNIATDLTPILSGYRFPNASMVAKDITFGMKFEAIITNRNLQILNEIRGKEYKNCRNAIIGILGSSDAWKYTSFITLIPLATSLEMERIDELNFMNKYYSNGEYNRFAIFSGNYQEILWHVNKFTQSAELIRDVLPYMIDGVVISFINKNKISYLGRVNSVNKWQMAIKFNPRKVRTIFLGYTYNIGKSGDITPMVHFKPVSFIGGIHSKQTIHSFARFNELNLYIGQEIDIEYRNDVITYVTKPDTQFNRNIEMNGGERANFITNCPFCGAEIEISKSFKSARCPNANCHERRIKRMTDMVDRLGFDQFSEETVRTLDLTNLESLATPFDQEELTKVIGPVNAINFIKHQKEIFNKPIQDYTLMEILSFDNMAEEKWKKIFKKYNLKALLAMNYTQLYDALTSIKGVGPGTVESIMNGINDYHDDLSYIYNNIDIINTAGSADKPKVAVTGFRDPMIIDIIRSQGYDCNGKYNVTKDTAILVTNDKNSNSSNMQKAKLYKVRIMSIEEFYTTHGIQISTF